MTQLQDAKLSKIEAFTVLTGTVVDLEPIYVAQLGAALDKNKPVQDLWHDFWDEELIADGQYNDRASAWLTSLGFTGGSVQDQWFAYWTSFSFLDAVVPDGASGQDIIATASDGIIGPDVTTGVTINLDGVAATINNAVLLGDTVTYTINETVYPWTLVTFSYDAGLGTMTSVITGAAMRDSDFAAVNNSTEEQILFVDTFTDVNGTSLDAHTPDTDVAGGGWTEVNLGLEIQGNIAQAKSAGSESPFHHADLIDVGVANYIVEVSIAGPAVVGTSQGQGLHLRNIDTGATNNGVRFGYNGGSADEWTIGAITPKLPAVGALAWDGTPFLLRAELSGNNIDYFIDDVLVGSESNPINVNSNFIILVSRNTTSGTTFNNLTVTRVE